MKVSSEDRYKPSGEGSVPPGWSSLMKALVLSNQAVILGEVLTNSKEESQEHAVQCSNTVQ